MSKTAAAKKSDKPFPAGNLTPHKLSQLVPGEMSSEEYKALVQSIKEDGQQNAIIVFENQILDGRHRYQACKELGIAPKIQQFTGDAKQAAALVLDNNLHRRSLNSMQKALVAARMHLEGAKLPQKDAAARVGVGVATVNLAVRLLNSNNTPLIKRCENGDATRTEIDELLYDREAARQAEAVQPTDTAGGSEEDDAPLGKASPGNVASINSHPDIKAGKRPARKGAQESPASRVVQHFKSLTAKERIDFVVLGWAWLEPALRAAEKLPKAMPQGKPIAQTQKQLEKATATLVDRAIAKGKRKVSVKALAKAAKPTK